MNGNRTKLAEEKMALDAARAGTLPRGPRPGAVASSAKVVVLVPVLNRPDRVQPLLDSLASTSLFVNVAPLFLVSPGDTEEENAILAAVDPTRGEHPLYRVVESPPGPGDYARKMNEGFQIAAGFVELVFLGADDVTFHPGWIERAIAAHLETEACVVGTNDLGNRQTMNGNASTHTLVHRDYLECGTIDEPGVLLHEGYDHQYVDTEFVETAKARGTFVHATDSIVEHHHPMWGKAKTDTTYQRGQAGAHTDRALYQTRRRLWEAL